MCDTCEEVEMTTGRKRRIQKEVKLSKVEHIYQVESLLFLCLLISHRHVFTNRGGENLSFAGPGTSLGGSEKYVFF